MSKRLACVEYLNTLPLIDGLPDDIKLLPDVPSNMANLLLSGEADMALCPVFEALTQPEIQMIPCGGIASDGATLTVRLFSQLPFADITEVHVDSASRTSVNLMRVLRILRGESPVHCHPMPRRITSYPDNAQALMLIGDKIITHPPDPARYPFSLDLGEAWKHETGLPFVFAIWCVRKDHPQPELEELLRTQLETNLSRCESIARAHAADHRWPEQLAVHYLTRILSYRMTDTHLLSIAHFGKLLQQLEN